MTRDEDKGMTTTTNTTTTSPWDPDHEAYRILQRQLAAPTGAIVSLTIPGLGQYTAHEDLFEQRLDLDRDALLAELIERAGEHPSDRQRFGRLTDVELAAVLADFDTAARLNGAEVTR
jgi:hypothetical protein